MGGAERPSYRSHAWPFVAVLGLLLGALLLLLVLGLGRTGGRLVYTLDDAYIHLAVAKNLALHGVWGITPHGFSSSCSSVLWPLLIAGPLSLVGGGTAVPFVLNTILAVLLLLVGRRLLSRAGVGGPAEFLGLLALGFLPSLPVMVFWGMEHLLQALLTLCLLWAAAREPAPSFRERPAQAFLPVIFALLLTATRYEGALVVPAAALVLALRRRWSSAALVVLAGALPVAAYGLVSRGHGWYFLPNSILLKGGLEATGGSLLRHIAFVFAPERLSVISQARTLSLFLVALAAVFAWRANPVRSGLRRLALGYVVAWLLHFAAVLKVGGHRYDAYLVPAGVVIAAVSFFDLFVAWRGPARRAAAVVLLLLAVLPPAVHGAYSLAQVVPSTKNIFEQQLQMAAFLDRFYQDQPVGLNDIGAVNYYADVRCVDLYGLANLDVCRAKLEGNFGPALIEDLCRSRGARVALVYESWFEASGGLPADWAVVARWRIRDNVVCGSDAVAFFATTPDHAPVLAGQLEQFRETLPRDVICEPLESCPAD